MDVFAAFSEANRLAAWWGPDGFTNTFEQFEFDLARRVADLAYQRENLPREVRRLKLPRADVDRDLQLRRAQSVRACLADHPPVDRIGLCVVLDPAENVLRP